MQTGIALQTKTKMKEKEKNAYIEWMGFTIAFILLVIVGKFPLPGVYTGAIMESLVLTFGLVAIGYGIRFMFIRHKYLKELDKQDK